MKPFWAFFKTFDIDRDILLIDFPGVYGMNNGLWFKSYLFFDGLPFCIEDKVLKRDIKLERDDRR